MLAEIWETSLGAARHWIRPHAESLVLALLLLLLLQTLRLAFLRSRARRTLRRHKNLGEAGERRARSFLQRSGFKIQGEQVSGSYRFMVDGIAQTVHLRADFVVLRRGRKYIAEVKSGAVSAKLSGRATRRQLLEYLFAFDVDGIVLVDMHEGKIHRVSFPALE